MEEDKAVLDSYRGECAEATETSKQTYLFDLGGN